jgi:uncharacterized protein (TIGR03435 family)
MIQHLLEDRFGLVFHHETRQMGGYDVVVERSSPRLTKSTGPAPDKSTVKGSQVEIKNGILQFTKDARSAEISHGSTVMRRGRNETMKRLAADLADKLGVPVMDATGLAGEYDYTLTYTAESEAAQGTVGSPQGGVPVSGELTAP